jgi:transcriptional regulatory protein RtcR
LDSTVARPIVALGFYGSTLDTGRGEERWERWRPTVSVCQHDDLAITRFELLHDRRFARAVESLTADIRQVSPETSVRPHEFSVDDPWDFASVYAALHDFARSYRFRPDEEDYLVHITTGTHVAQICLFLLTETRHLPGRLLQTAPPRNGEPPSGRYAIIDLAIARYDAIARRFAREAEEGASFLKSGIATRSRRFNRLIEQLEHVALRTTEPLLLMGPTGAGKSQLATRIFELKKQRHQLKGSFVEVNCATLRGDSAMSTLFGHRKGAFTGALKDRPGLLRTADQGVLFLDEIGELGSDEQAMLLRALEEKRFLPVGADRESSSEFQLIAGTNRDLRAAVAEGRFRDDLLARINLWIFELPGLTERHEDIEPNLDYELDRFATRTGRRISFNQEALERWLGFARSPAARWTGNFRDLNASVTRMATLAPQGRIDEPIVEEELRRLERDWAAHARPSGSRNDSELLERTLKAAHARDASNPPTTEALDRFDAVQLADVLSACRDARSLAEAGRRLFAVSRTRKSTPNAPLNDSDRLRKYLARFGIEFEDVRAG